MEGDLDGVILLQVTEATETLFSIPSGCIYLALHFLFLFFLLFFSPESLLYSVSLLYISSFFCAHPSVGEG